MRGLGCLLFEPRRRGGDRRRSDMLRKTAIFRFYAESNGQRKHTQVAHDCIHNLYSLFIC